MSKMTLTTPIELTDAELDLISGGQANSNPAANARGLVSVAANVSAAADNVANNLRVLNNPNIPVAVQVNILGGGVNVPV